MSKRYEHVSKYENEILELQAQGLTKREIGEALGFNYKQIDNYIYRYNVRQKRLEAGMIPQRKGRPRKNDNELPPSIQRLDKLTQVRYELASKERYIKRLEMENELMRDFLSLTERK